MQKIDHTKLNRSNNDIWGLLSKAIETGNVAVVKVNLDRLYELQKYYIKILNFQDAEIEMYKNEVAVLEDQLSSYEKDWIKRIAKDNNVYEETRERINRTF